jgi:N utilization substance protein B
MSPVKPISSKPIPLSLRRKTSARVATVQCLYRLKVNDEVISPEALCEDFLAQWDDDKASKSRVLSKDAEPDRGFFRKLLVGAVEKQPEINEIIKASLNEKWTAERMSPLLLAIIAAAIYEMKWGGSLNPSIIVSEYVTMTGRFFEEAEIGFVNGVLDGLGKAG